jgi:AraC family transcriptional regulator of adaptative response / DNA-3-methyladenine glycosylase II
MLAFLSAQAIAGVETVEDGCYHRTISILHEHGTVSARQGAGNALSVTIRFPRLMSLPMIIARLRNLFDLAADPDAINRQLSVDPLMARLTTQRPGLRIPGSWDGFELAARMVLRQHGATPQLVDIFLKHHGEVLPAPTAARHGLTHMFPTASRLRAVDGAVEGMAAACAKTLSALAALLEADPHLLDTCADPAHTLRKLRAVPGMHDSTIEAIATRQLRDPDAFSSEDQDLMTALARLEGIHPDKAELTRRAHQWRPWRAYAAQHLLASLA